MQALADRIRSTIAALPPSSNVAAYQAQISSTLNDGYTCEVVREALARPYTAPGEAQKALGRLRSMFTQCNFGTGAVSRGGGAYGAWGVGFSVGGGSSNYRP
ncbi:MAG: hypothetical protein EOP58_16315 [Sphingomonadales bacterium]|nr:MAG: hypothetical protein EOP58_16315 [Sphingomonadales bacterium]